MFGPLLFPHPLLFLLSLLLHLLLILPSAHSTISDSFRQFVQNRYGPAVTALLARDDLGEEGSYGGGDHVAGEKTESAKGIGGNKKPKIGSGIGQRSLLTMGLRKIQMDWVWGFGRKWRIFYAFCGFWIFGMSPSNHFLHFCLESGISDAIRDFPPNPISRLPVLFVHGLLTSAGSTRPMAAFFTSAGGYSDEELYATTYGPRGTLLWNAAMECQFAQALRYLIIAVSEFTDSQVNVVAYSLGVPIVRKAMLGGRCVDGGGALGRGPLTRFVHTFLAVAGPNRGIGACSLPLAPRTSSCNSINGLRCNSRFLNDINSRQHYEARIVYVIQSTGDRAIGNLVCGVQTTAIPGADYTLTFEGLSHIQVIMLTTQQQFNLITKHTVN